MQLIQAHSSNYTQGRIGDIKFLVIHYTANDGDTSTGNAKYFQGANRKASAHYFVDENGITQSVKEGDTAWHCGATKYVHNTCRNANSIGIELCSDIVAGSYTLTLQTVENAVQLCKELMKKYNISIQNVLRHYDVTGKMCPQPFVKNSKLWDDFKRQLQGDSQKMELVSINDIIYRLHREEIVTDKEYWTKRATEDTNIYWLLRKMANHTLIN